jgi:hypothetical protein
MVKTQTRFNKTKLFGLLLLLLSYPLPVFLSIYGGVTIYQNLDSNSWLGKGIHNDSFIAGFWVGSFSLVALIYVTYLCWRLARNLSKRLNIPLFPYDYVAIDKKESKK